MSVVLVVDDEASILRSVERLLSDDEDIELLTTVSANEGLSMLERKSGKVDLVISDERMPGVSGSDFLSVVKDRYPKTLRIILTGYADQTATIKAINSAEVFRYLTKPWDPAALLSTIKDALEIKALKDRTEELTLKVIAQKDELAKANASLEEKVALRTEQLVKSLEALKRHNAAMASQRQGITDFMSAFMSLQEPLKTRISKQIGETWTEFAGLSKLKFSEEGAQAARISPFVLDGPPLFLELLASIDGLQGMVKILSLSRENPDGSGPKKLGLDQIPAESRLLRIIHDHFSLNPGNAGVSRAYITSHAPQFYDSQMAQEFYSFLPSVNDRSPRLSLGPEQLLDGMRLAEDLHLSNGSLLLASGTILNDKIIVQLKKVKAYLAGSVEIFSGARDEAVN